MTEFLEGLSREDLDQVTSSLHKIIPRTRGFIIDKIEKVQPGDRSMVFHGRRYGDSDYKHFIISYEYILEVIAEYVDLNKPEEQKG